eukprot:Nk52_evm2s287 gene=Nk52_evmTU2s287
MGKKGKGKPASKPDTESSAEMPAGHKFGRESTPENTDVYLWSQTDESVEISISYKSVQRLTAKDVSVEITCASVSAGLKKCAPTVFGELFERVKADQSIWNINYKDGFLVLELHLEKLYKGKWPYPIKVDSSPGASEGAPVADGQSCLEAAKYFEKEKGDYVRAHELLKLGAACSHKETLLKLAAIYQVVSAEFYPNLEKDLGKSAHYFECASKQGSREAMFFLAQMHQQALGLELNLKSATEWYLRSVEGGWTGVTLDQYLNSPLSYLDPLRVGQTKSPKYLVDVPAIVNSTGRFLAPSHTYYTSALFNLGVIYQSEGPMQDYRKAVYYWSIAAAHGYPAAFYNLGIFYLEGRDSAIQKNSQCASYCFTIANRIEPTKYPKYEPTVSATPKKATANTKQNASSKQMSGEENSDYNDIQSRAAWNWTDIVITGVVLIAAFTIHMKYKKT